jgi:anti-sigma regulatory factor (Ser/Thr protein kinase)
MNERTFPGSAPEGIPAPRRSVIPPPWRLNLSGPGRHGIVLGPDPHHVGLARRWADRVAHDTGNASFALITAVSELVTNAQRHTRSGDPGGTTTVVVERRPFAFVLTVTDNGPRPGPTIPVPRIEDRHDPLAVGGYGLRMLDTLAAYWDWSGKAGGPITVRALLDRDPGAPPGTS